MPKTVLASRRSDMPFNSVMPNWSRGWLRTAPVSIAAAVVKDHAGFVELLLERGADIAATGGGGQTVMHAAAVCASLPLCVRLLAAYEK